MGRNSLSLQRHSLRTFVFFWLQRPRRMPISFFFQAEDGIRDLIVTEFRRVLFRSEPTAALNDAEVGSSMISSRGSKESALGSGERRVGKEGRSRGAPYHLKKKTKKTTKYKDTVTERGSCTRTRQDTVTR